MDDQIATRRYQTYGSGPILEARAINKSFPSLKTSIQVLRNLDFSLNQNETLAVVGASGIGKSTLLHILGTLDRPDSGSLLFHGEDTPHQGQGRPGGS